MDVPPGVDVVPIHDAEDVKTSKKAPMGLAPGSRRAKKISKETPLRFVDVTSLGPDMQIVKVRKKPSVKKTRRS